MTLSEWDYGARTNPRSTGNRDLAWVEIRPSGPVVCRTDGQRLVVDLKRSVGMGAVTNTALGPSTIEAIRAAWGSPGSPVSAELLPKARWSNGERIPDALLRTLIWWTYGHAQGLTRDQIVYDGAADQLRYGEARGGEISPDVRCIPVQRREARTGTGTGTGNTGTGTGTGNTGTGTGTGNTGTGNTGTGNTGTGNTGTGNTGDGGDDGMTRTLGRVVVGLGVAGVVGLGINWLLTRWDASSESARAGDFRRVLEAPPPRRESAPPGEPPADLVGAPEPRERSTRRGYKTMRGML